MKLNIRNFIIFLIVLGIVFIGIISSGKINFGKTIYVVSPNENIEESVSEEYSADNEKMEIDENSKIAVYISGEVKTCGVVNVNVGDRLIDAVDKLGGLTENADLNKVNLAIKLEDGCHYIIPKKGEFTQEQERNKFINTNRNNDSINSAKININTATLNELNTLPGIGNVISSRIIAYRKQNGNFNSISDIKNVSGIGDKKFEAIKDLITVN